jgi:RNA polymerase sigma-70 factor (ECF subfamily)
VVTGQSIVDDASAAVQADDDPLEAAVHEHARFVYRITYAVLRNHHDAEDAAQETFLRVLRYGKSFEGVRDRKTWLARIAWRVALDRRRTRRDVALEDGHAVAERLPAPEPGAEATLIDAEAAALLGRLIETLPAPLREAMTLATVRDLPHGAIAEVLGIEEAAVRSRLFRGRQILKQKLVGVWGGRRGT